MLRLSLLVAIAGVLGSGCTRTYNVRRPATVVELEATMMSHDSGTVTPLVAWATTTTTTTSAVRLGPTTLPPAGEARAADLTAIRGYEVKRRLIGTLEGFLIGAGLGVITGAAIGTSLGSDGDCSSPDDPCVFRLSSDEKAAIGAVLAGVSGAVIGTLVGAIRGHTDRYLF